MTAYQSEEPIELSHPHPHIAVITLNRPTKYNALSLDHFARLATLLRTVSDNPQIVATILTGNGKFFSAGADVTAAERGDLALAESTRIDFVKRFAITNLELPAAFSEHRPILVAALNGPAIGIMAAVLGHCDFVHAVESAYIFCPFATLGLVAEGGSSASFIARLGVARAKSALILGKKLTVPELASCGFVNKVYPDQPAAGFRTAVVAYFEEKLDGLDYKSVIDIKALVNRALPDPTPATVRELMGTTATFSEGRPQKEFAKFAKKEKRHKL